MTLDPKRCPLSYSWALRGYNGTCSCGAKARVRNDGKLVKHNKPATTEDSR